MIYNDIYKTFKDASESVTDSLELKELSIRIRKRKFISSGTEISQPFDFAANLQIQSDGFYNNDANGEFPDYVNDCNISSNNSFEYFIIENINDSPAKGIIFLFHGLNEKRWDKYFPWAYELVHQTGKTVILFPMAFHMNRAPSQWSDSRLMNKVAIRRAGKLPNAKSSFINAAISERLENSTHRFLMSGIQTYRDLCFLIKSIRNGNDTVISKNTSIDLFGYSIGAFLCLLLLMDNPDKEFGNSRLFTFCGGATFDEMMPVSRYIMDLRALQYVKGYFSRELDNKNLMGKKLEQWFSGISVEKSYFPSLINQKDYKEIREKRIYQIHERINAIALSKDEVVPPSGVFNTLNGISGNIKTGLDVLDFEYPYDHVTPFPVTDKYKLQVDYSFRHIMESSAVFLS
jgi:hypothetical protein